MIASLIPLRKKKTKFVSNSLIATLSQVLIKGSKRVIYKDEFLNQIREPIRMFRDRSKVTRLISPYGITVFNPTDYSLIDELFMIELKPEAVWSWKDYVISLQSDHKVLVFKGDEMVIAVDVSLFRFKVEGWYSQIYFFGLDVNTLLHCDLNQLETGQAFEYSIVDIDVEDFCMEKDNSSLWYVKLNGDVYRNSALQFKVNGDFQCIAAANKRVMIGTKHQTEDSLVNRLILFKFGGRIMDQIELIIQQQSELVTKIEFVDWRGVLICFAFSKYTRYSIILIKNNRLSLVISKETLNMMYQGMMVMKKTQSSLEIALTGKFERLSHFSFSFKS